MAQPTLDITQLFAPASSDAGSRRATAEPASGFADRLHSASEEVGSTETTDVVSPREELQTETETNDSSLDQSDSGNPSESSSQDDVLNKQTEERPEEQHDEIDTLEEDVLELSDENPEATVAVVVAPVEQLITPSEATEVVVAPVSNEIVSATTSDDGAAQITADSQNFGFQFDAQEIEHASEALAAESEEAADAEEARLAASHSEITTEQIASAEGELVEQTTDGTVAASAAVSDEGPAKAKATSTTNNAERFTVANEAEKTQTGSGDETQDNDDHPSQSKNLSPLVPNADNQQPTEDSPSEEAPKQTPAQAVAPTTADRPAAESQSATLTDIATGRVTGTRQEGSSSSGPRVDVSRFVSRVSGALRAAQDRGGTVQLRLSPPELGALQIRLSINEGVLTAALETETSAARNLLLDNLPALRERLAEQEIRVEKFDVDVRQEGGGQRQEDWQPGEKREQSSEQDQQRQAETNERNTQAQEETTPGISSRGSDGEIINFVA